MVRSPLLHLDPRVDGTVHVDRMGIRVAALVLALSVLPMASRTLVEGVITRCCRYRHRHRYHHVRYHQLCS